MNTSQLTFTRFVAAISIVIFHFGNDIYPFNNVYLSPLVHSADLGVSYFFTLSGFVMIIAYGRRAETIDYISYLKNRIARILPLYYLAMVIMLIYLFIRIHLLKVPSVYVPSFTDMILNLFLIQGWIFGKATTINTAAWSLSAEAFFYILFPLLFNKIYSKVSMLSVFIFIFSFFILSQLFFNIGIQKYPQLLSYFLYNPLLHLNEFVVGNLIGFFMLRQTKLPAKSTLIPVSVFFILSIAFALVHIEGISFHNGFFIIFFAPIIYLLAVDNGIIADILRRKFFVYLGEISYAVYILQFPVYLFFTATLTFLGFKINQPLFFVYLLVLIFASSISYELIEKPCRQLLRSR